MSKELAAKAWNRRADNEEQTEGSIVNARE